MLATPCAFNPTRQPLVAKPIKSGVGSFSGPPCTARPQTHLQLKNKVHGGRIVVNAQAAGMPPAAPSKVEAKNTEPTSTGRRIVFAVDGTADAEEGLRWVVKHIARSGDTIHLAHVICDTRSSSASAAATQWNAAREETLYRQEFFLRMEHEAQGMLAARFTPSLQFTGIHHEVDLIKLRQNKSAAAIGEALANRAVAVKADLLIIASHGAGVLADYGSVARWCSDKSIVPTLLLPPSVMTGAAAAAPPASGILVAATDDMAALKESFDFAVAALARKGDTLYVMHARNMAAGDEAAEVAARKELVLSAGRWLEESASPLAPTLTVAVELVTDSLAESGSGDLGPSGSTSPAGERICAHAADLRVRAVVLHHHQQTGQHSSMMRDMMCGPLTLGVTKQCSRPLVVLGATKQ